MKTNNRYVRLFITLLVICFVFSLFLISATNSGKAATSQNIREVAAAEPVLANSTVTTTTVFLPLTQKDYPWISPFGIETYKYLTEGSFWLSQAEGLGSNWVRLNGKISWKDLQPNEGDPIDWAALADFENVLKALKASGMTPIVVIDDHPHWAVKPFYKNGEWVYSSCAAIKTEKFSAFASFVRKIVGRYSDPQYGVHHWELGNEPDVDPTQVVVDNIYGCWGDVNDPYYGGEHYGNMLKVVGPAIKDADPSAKVWIGGLLLDSPNTTNPALGRPELFLQGILEAGAAGSFDIVGYHSYPPYQGKRIDYDTDPYGKFVSWGGNVVGKARFLRSIMSQYGVTKPVFLNETGLMCPDHFPYDVYCTPPDGDFFRAQADHVVRTFTRGISENVMGFVWYTLEPQWRYTGLLSDLLEIKPVYLAFQQLNTRLDMTKYVGEVDYGVGMEAYAFQDAFQYTHVVWAKEDETFTISVPVSGFIEAYDRYGNLHPKVQVGNSYQIQVDFSPIYLLFDL